MKKWLFLVGLVLLLVVAASAASCLPWQRPPEGQIVYVGPTEQGLAPGEFLPGTDIQYMGLVGDEAEFLIEGRRAMKKKGDSLDWDGHPLPGATLNLKQRIVWYSEDKLHAAGSARLAIDEPEPVAMRFPEELPVLYKLPATYNVKRGETIPGTTIGYEGSSDQGAELSGLQDYPYRKIADSITWEGQLQEGIFLQVTLRVAFFSEDQLQVAGLATIGLLP